MNHYLPPILLGLIPLTAALAAAAPPRPSSTGGLTIEGDILTVVQKTPFDVVAPTGYKWYSWTVPAGWKSNARPLTKLSRIKVTDAPEGTGEVAVFGVKGDDVEEWSLKVHVGKPGTPPTPPTPPYPPTPPTPPPGSPLAALAQIQFGTAGCTATLIGGVSYNGQLALTAAHCIKSVGQTGNIKLKDGRTFTVKVVSLNRNSDVAWLDVDTRGSAVPTAFLADSEPAISTRVWHSGYGIDKPGNREEGTVIGPPTTQGQLVYRLSVSPGDSGGGIITDATGRVLSPVCCTTCLGCVGTVYGGSVASVRAIMPAKRADASKMPRGPALPLPPIRTTRVLDDGKLFHPILHIVPMERRCPEQIKAMLYYPVKELGELGDRRTR